jgi:hypothetical protein
MEIFGIIRWVFKQGLKLVSPEYGVKSNPELRCVGFLFAVITEGINIKIITHCQGM